MRPPMPEWKMGDGDVPSGSMKVVCWRETGASALVVCGSFVTAGRAAYLRALSDGALGVTDEAARVRHAMHCAIEQIPYDPAACR